MKTKIINILLILLAYNLVNAEETVISNKTEETLPKYSQRKDSFIDKEFVYSEESSKYQIRNNDKVKIILETKNNDIEYISIVYNGIEKIMNGIGNYKGKEMFMVEVPNKDTEYYFNLKDGKAKYEYGKINKDSKLVEKFKYVAKSNFTSIPEWSKAAVGYQIYIDSFRNGDIDNDPIFNEYGADDFKEPNGELRSGTKKSDLVYADWNNNAPEFTVNKWNGNYEEENTWEINALNDLKNYTRYYGGDLEGINEKLDYIENIGVDYIVMSPPFYSFSNHKYNAIYFNHIDPYFGHMEQTGTNKELDVKSKVHNKNGDKELNLLIYNPKTNSNLLGETVDSSTWVWTDSDLEMANLVKNAHKRNIKVVIQIALDLTSNNFFANIDDKYSSWYKNKEELRLDLSKKEVRTYIIDSLKKWVLGPDNSFKDEQDDDGIDGIQYVYYSDENKQYLKEITEELKKYKREILVLGENYKGIDDDVPLNTYDAGMDYNIVNNMISYIVNTNSNYKIDNVEFATKLNEIYNKYSDDRFKSSQIYLSSMDTDRIFSNIINPNRVFDRNNQSNQGYLNIRPDIYDPTAVSKMKMMVAMQMTLPASPIIYYGDEKGMWGSDSPRNRKPMLWDDFEYYDNESDNINNYQSRLRSFPEEVVVNEIEKKIYYPVQKNSEIEDFYKKILEIRKSKKELFKNGKLRVIEASNSPNTKSRIDQYTSEQLENEKRKSKIYRGLDIKPKVPNIDFITYEISTGKQSMIVVVNNSSDAYNINVNVPKLFGKYENLLVNKEKYLIYDKKMEFHMKPYEVKILYSESSGIFDSIYFK